MRITTFSTGRVRLKRADRGVRRYIADDWCEHTLPVNVFLIEHPDGLCLVDAGQTAAAADRRYFPRWYPFFRLARFELRSDDEAAAQIQAAGFDVRDVRWVVLTHLHTDHFGGVAAFSDADTLVSRVEWEAAQGVHGRLRGYLPQRWPAGLRPHLVDFSGPAIGPFAASHDVASDGRMLFVPLPGHTRGHAALLVKRDALRWYLFAGDAALRATELARSVPEVANWCRHHDAVVLTTHDEMAPHLLSRSG